MHIKRRLHLYLTAAHYLSALPRSLAHWDLPTLIYYVSLGWWSFSHGSGAISHVKQRASKVTAFKDDNFQIMGPHCFHPHSPTPPHPPPLHSMSGKRQRQGVATIQASINTLTASQLVPAGRCETLRRPLRHSQALHI